LSGFSLAAEAQKGDLLVNARLNETQKIFEGQSFEFGFMYWYLDYKEDLPAPLKSTEKGWLPGFYLGWNYNKKNNVYSKIFLEFSWGDVTYDGTDQSGTIPITFSDDNHQFFFEENWTSVTILPLQKMSPSYPIQDMAIVIGTAVKQDLCRGQYLKYPGKILLALYPRRDRG